MSDESTDQSPRRKQRIAILGGGPAGLSTAFHLTSRPNWQDEYEITIYQLGWRAGGKAASSRNSAHGQRIEEHGIHLFGNFYFNMFSMLDECYRALYGPKGDNPDTKDEPVRTIGDAFTGSNFQALPDVVDGRWKMQTGWLAHNDGVPWSGEMPDPDTVVNAIAYQALAVLTGKRPGFVPHERAGKGFAGIIRRLEDWVIRRVARAVQRHLDRDVKDHSKTLEELAAVRDRLRRFMRRFTTHSESFRWKFVQIDLLATLLQGIIADEVLSPGFEIDTLDKWDYREWLQLHGVDPISLASGFAQIVPNIGFNYPDGDSTQYPAFSAAPYVYFFIRQMVASGDALYFFASGTGDSVVAPVYRTLVQRGVKFEFFHKVTEVAAGKDSIDTIDTIRFEVQAHVKPEHAPYDPLIRVKGMYTWPDHPKYGQLVEGPLLASGKVDLESYWADWKGEEKVLTRGAEGDDGFDYVVLAISVAALPTICPDILQRPDWQQMVDKIQAFPTQQLQIWLDKSVEELGWDYHLDPTSGDRVVGANYTYPYITFCDFTDLIEWEDWPEGKQPKSVIYFSGTLQKPTEWPPYSDHDFPQREHLRARATAIQYLRTIRGLLPDANTNPDQPESLDFTLLHQTEHDPAVRGEALFDSQYWRANIDPTERYVGSVKQTVQYRKKAWESGFTNMALAGDWTYNGMNIGSIESAATSGAMASLALTGFPALDDIPGLTFLHGDLKGPSDPLMPVTPVAPTK